MIRKLMPFLSKYKLAAILSPLMMVGEVFAEVRIPILMATIVDEYIPVGDTQKVMETGLLMIGMALMSLCFGALGSFFSSKAAMGFGAELRGAMFSKIQGFSFSNVDKFSTASLVTRMTTDVTRIQMAVVMILRVCVRAPVMFVSALTMAYSVNQSLIMVLAFAIPVLAIGIAIFMSMAYPRFIVMFKKYDKLNAVVQENLIAIRAVKAYVREKFEKSRESYDFRRSPYDDRNVLLHYFRSVAWRQTDCIRSDGSRRPYKLFNIYYSDTYVTAYGFNGLCYAGNVKGFRCPYS